MRFSNRVYDILKRCVTTILPAIGTAYFALSMIWGLPYGEEIGGTIDSVCLLIGTCINISTRNYRNGGDNNGV